MLLDDDDDLRIEGPQGAVLFEVYTTVVGLLEQSGHTRQDADSLALQLLPRLHDRLASAGLVVRQVHDMGRHERVERL